MKLELRSLRVKNCGPLDDVLIDFCDASGQTLPVTVLAGANGSGKTTILDTIVGLSRMLPHSAFYGASNSTLAYHTILEHTEFAQIDWLIDGKEYTMSYGSAPPMTKMANHHFSRTVTEGKRPLDEIDDFTEQISAQIADQEDAPIYIYGDTGKQTITRQFVFPSLLYFPYLRFLKPVQGEQIQREETNYHWIYAFETPHSFRGSLDSYLIWLNWLKDDEPKPYEQIIEFLNGLDFDGKTFGVQRKELRAIVTTRTGKTHGVAELSSGEQNILIMLLELRRRLLPHSILLIDEIENSLHPAFQYKLAQSLLKMQEQIPFQLIVTTHSPAFLDVFGEKSLRILTEF